MEEYPSNSHNKPDHEEKRVHRVTTSDPKMSKKPLGRRFAETFMGGDARGAWNSVIIDVLIPAVKDMALDAITEGAQQMLGLGSGRRNRSSSGSSQQSSSWTSYRQSSSGGGGGLPARAEVRELSRRARANHDFGEITVNSRAEANEVLEQMYTTLSQYEQVTVADLYELTGYMANFTDNKWGWTDLTGSRIANRGRKGYAIELPRPVALT